MKLIPFEELESTPVFCSRDANYQVCKYKTSITNSLPAIEEETTFPSMRDIMMAVIRKDEHVPKTKVQYSVFDRYVREEPESLPEGEGYNTEPYYNSETKLYEYLVYKVFTSIEDSYNHIKINFENGVYNG